MAKKKENEYMQGLYEDMTLDELKDDVIKNLKRENLAKSEKKDYNDSYREMLKELDERISALLYWVGVKETEKERLALEAAAVKALEG